MYAKWFFLGLLALMTSVTEASVLTVGVDRQLAVDRGDEVGGTAFLARRLPSGELDFIASATLPENPNGSQRFAFASPHAFATPDGQVLEDLVVGLGTNNFFTPDEEWIFEVERVHIAPGFGGVGINDFAVLELNRQIPDEFLIPISFDPIPSGAPAVHNGFGIAGTNEGVVGFLGDRTAIENRVVDVNLPGDVIDENILVSIFDNPLFPGVSPITGINTPGDSGGVTAFDINGNYVGFALNVLNSGSVPDFRSATGAELFSAHEDFIMPILSVPEPGTAIMMASALFVFLCRESRQ